MPRVPLLKLLLQAYFSLVVAIIIGSMISAPFIITRAKSFTETNYLVDTVPADDSALKNWALAQPGVLACQIQREGGELHVRVEHLGLQQRPAILEFVSQMRTLGYGFRGMRGGASGLISTTQELITDAPTLAVLLAGTQVAFGVIGWLGIRRARQRRETLRPLLAGSPKLAFVTGILCGIGLLLFGYLYGIGLEKLLGKAPTSPWDTADTMPLATKFVFLLFGGLGAPLAEEIYFRGYLFNRFQSVGQIWIGLIVTSLLFGVVHFSDPYNVPAICVYGAVLAWSFHYTQSLLAPILTHVINNCSVILWMVLA